MGCDDTQKETANDIANVNEHVNQITTETRETKRDVQDIKDDVKGISEKLDSIQATASKKERAPRPQRVPTQKHKPLPKPFFTTKQGAATLTGVSLNDLALRIKAQDPSKSFSDAKKEARKLKEAHSAISTGGGGVLANAKLGILRKTLGENLGTKVSRFLTSNKTQEKAAQTLINFDAQKIERVQAAQTAEPVQALQQQVQQLAKTVEKNTAVRVEAPKPVVESKKKEDLSDAIAALKVLGFEMKEIKDRLSTLPHGLSTEDQIKHALKSTTERIQARDLHAAVSQAITDNASPAPKAAPQEEIKSEGSTKDNIISEYFKKANDSNVTPVQAVRTPVKQDDIVNQEKADQSKEKDDAKKKDDTNWRTEVGKKLASIQKGIKDIHSESFIGLLVMALGALLIPLVKKVIEGVQWIREKLQPLFDMITNIWNKYFSSNPKSLNNKIERAYTDANTLAMKAEQEGDPNKARQIREDANRKIDQLKDDDDMNEKLKKQGLATSPEEALKLGKKSYIRYEDGNGGQVHIMNADDYKQLGVDPPDYMIKPAKKETPKIEPPKTPSVLKNQADALQKATDDKVQNDSKPTASTIVIPMPTKETQVAVPVNMGGGDSAIAVLAARNDDPTTQSYIGSLFDHPATYGALGRV